MWMGEVEMNTWMRARSAAARASAARSMSSATVRARLAMTGPATSAAILDTAVKSPGEEAANPASITSTFSLASWVAIATLSSGERAMPGACSPSRRVVSKMISRSSAWLLLAGGCLGGGVVAPAGRSSTPRPAT